MIKHQKLAASEIVTLNELIGLNGSCVGKRCSDCIVAKYYPLCKENSDTVKHAKAILLRDKKLTSKSTEELTTIKDREILKRIISKQGGCYGILCSGCPIEKADTSCNTDDHALQTAKALLKEMSPRAAKPKATSKAIHLITLQDFSVGQVTPLQILKTLINNLQYQKSQKHQTDSCVINGRHCEACPIKNECHPSVSKLPKIAAYKNLAAFLEGAEFYKALNPQLTVNTDPVVEAPKSMPTYKKGTWVTLTSTRPDQWNLSGRMDYLLGADIQLPVNLAPGQSFIYANENVDTDGQIHKTWSIHYDAIVGIVDPVTCYKKGTWVKLVDTRPSHWNRTGNMDYLLGAVVQLHNDVYAATTKPTNVDITMRSFGISRGNGQLDWFLKFCSIARKATPKEIANAKSNLPQVLVAGTYVKLTDEEFQVGEMNHLCGTIIRLDEDVAISKEFTYRSVRQSDGKCVKWTLAASRIERLATADEVEHVRLPNQLRKGQWVKLKGTRDKHWAIGVMDSLLHGFVQLSNDVSCVKSGFQFVAFRDGGEWNLMYSDIDRAATPHESRVMESASARVQHFGKVKFEIYKDVAQTPHGRVSLAELQEAIRWIENPPSLSGHTFTVHSNGNYRTIGNLSANATDEYGKVTTIGFGCQTGTLGELKAILDAVKKSNRIIQ